MKSDLEMIDYIQSNDDCEIFNSEVKQLEMIIYEKLDIDMKAKYKLLLVKYIKKIKINDDNIDITDLKLDDIDGDYLEEKPAYIDNTNNIIYDGKQLSDDQMKVYKSVLEYSSVLITGAGGVGKSLLILAIIDHLKGKYLSYQYGVTSTTGCSSLLIKGSTIHSFLKIGLANVSAELLYNKLSAANKDRLKELKVLIIDEISMLDRTLFEKISEYLKLIKKDEAPFGGVQLILSGDMAQLSPVDVSSYCFKSPVWNLLELKIFNLTKSFRQSDEEFVNILNSIRMGNCTNAIYNRLEQLKDTKFEPGIVPVQLLPINKMVDEINCKKFLELSEYHKKYEFHIVNVNNYANKTLIASEKKRANIPDQVDLCVDCQIMITFNIDAANHLVNGTMGIVKSINNVTSLKKTVDIFVFSTKQTHTIEYIQYKYCDFTSKSQYPKEIVLFQYMPITVAYATTIHKSQGKTIDYLEINLGQRVFANGQAYTALSRARSLNNIKLSDLSKRAFKCDPIVKKFYDEIKK